ncbi:MAG TPA: NADH-quinone oxidoreductase subunit M [Arenicellales bacterium]|jgi:NADH-quinone oxidoreductase subunit M|uniref:NADH:quinone oxidoreductase/Mrp antiporter membrane subunit domain-containing protein n=1 Tax=marine metagenome TaxID=408172 RepID=A0A381PWN7_9ZZZZ|nr:NADH-quinone oxidoreductase subunit M [Arenicellales bacterium]|tara:strand:+ start:270 stop:1757 length:1488 start_codon:yes stop_codon:yes gene_type:complete
MDSMTPNILSILIWLPVLGGILILSTGGDRNAQLARKIALGFSVGTFLLSLSIYADFDINTASMQFVERYRWIEALHIQYFLGVDGISMPLIILTTLLTIIVVIAGWEVITKRVAQYMASFLIMEGLMIGVFSSMDAILFYLFWEAMLIPMFLIIGVWGGSNRVYAAIKFFLYTLVGSLLMLVAIIYLYFTSDHTFNIASFHATPLTYATQVLIFLAFFAAFAVKVPMFPVHTWLPDAHVEAPTGGSVILAAITLKMGAYGFLRFSIPITPDASSELAIWVIGLSLIAVVYIALVALVQRDMKKLIAYSSISHMGFVTLGFFIFDSQGMEGAIVQMISHGFISGALFLCVGVLYDRMHSREIDSYGGVATTMPVFSMFLVFFAMSNAGLPGTSGFVGEFLVILGSFRVNGWYAAVAGLTLVLGAAYTLWMIKRVVYGEITNEKVKALVDVNGREKVVLGVLAVCVLGLGVYPMPLLEVMHSTVENLLEHAAVSKL